MKHLMMQRLKIGIGLYLISAFCPIYAQNPHFIPFLSTEQRGWSIHLNAQNHFTTDIHSLQTFINHQSENVSSLFHQSSIHHPSGHQMDLTGMVGMKLSHAFIFGAGATRLHWRGPENKYTSWGPAWSIHISFPRLMFNLWGKAGLSSHGVQMGTTNTIQATHSVNEEILIMALVRMNTLVPPAFLFGINYQLNPEWSTQLSLRVPNGMIQFGLTYSMDSKTNMTLYNDYHLKLGHSPGVSILHQRIQNRP